MREKLEKIRDLINELIDSLNAETKVQNAPAQISEPNPPQSREFALLRELLESSDWPQAVPSFQIADENSEKDKEERAGGICDIILPPLLGKKFLDFGCGEGHVAKQASKDAAFSVGFDLSKPASSLLEWEQESEKFILTSDFEKVKSYGPYDVILIYDVIDHSKSDAPSEILSKAGSLLSEGGKIYLRCHPWCGRHGGHSYKKINKAFVHLVFSEAELDELGAKADATSKILAPLYSYAEIISASGLVQESEPEVDSQEVETFFKENPLVRERILKLWDLKEWGSSPPEFQMSQCFIDYVLKK